MSFNTKVDLTRWNRAGLNEFRYIDGNAITFLEALRQQMVVEFDGDGVPSWSELVSLFPELPHETRKQLRERLQQQYYGPRRDYGWEILRTLARSAHVLGEYTNAYANEAYLSTAVEWDNIRKLVGMLGYRPAPPASAETHIALLFKDGESGDVDKGFAVKNKPAEGESTVIFETQEKLAGDARLNRLRVRDWNKNLGLLKQTSKGGKSDRWIRFPLTDEVDKVRVGDLGVLATPSFGLPVKVAKRVDNLESPYLQLSLLSPTKLKTSFALHETTLYLQPEFVASPLANGAGSALLKAAANLATDEMVFGKKDGAWQARWLRENHLGHVQFDEASAPPAKGEKLFRALSLNYQRQPKLTNGPHVYLLPHGDDGTSGPLVDADLKTLSVTVQSDPVLDAGGSRVDTIHYIAGSHGPKIYYPADEIVGVIDRVGLEDIRFAGKAKGMETDSWALVTHKDGTQAACRIDSIDQDEDWFDVDLSGVDEPVAMLRGAFALSLTPRDHDVNKRQPWQASSTDAVTVVALDDAKLVDVLRIGQKLICAGDGYAAAVEIRDIIVAEDGAHLHLAPPFHAESAARVLSSHDCVLYGNVVRATHGESQPEKILGNGDAAQASQIFKLPSNKVSWVSDAAFSAGVRADLLVRVGARVWQQVENLDLSGPEDHHYQVVMDQDDVLSIGFGDGQHGRRLPTGIDNVRVRYRDGYGEDGNLDANGLVKIARSHRLVDDFAAPLPAVGGAAKESAESMRENAPATVLALKRAVSLQDFTHLAAHHSMVWQAKAFEKMPDRPGRPLIEVVVVPAGGTTFATGSDMAALIESYLGEHAAPGTNVSVTSYQPLFICLAVSLMVDEAAFDNKQVEQAVRAHLQNRLALKQRRLGQPLFRSEVIALLEQVDGVENGHVELLATPYSGLDSASRPRLHKADDGGIRRISPKPHQLLYLDAEAYALDVEVRRYEI
jgi:hypothetical protein